MLDTRMNLKSEGAYRALPSASMTCSLSPLLSSQRPDWDSLEILLRELSSGPGV